MKKIIVLNPVGFIGGAEISLLSFLSFYRENVTVVIVPFEGRFTEELSKLNIKFIVIPAPDGFNEISRKKSGLSSIKSFLSYSKKISKILKRTDFDYIYSNGLKMDLLSILIGFKLKKKVFWHIRDILGIKYKIIFNFLSLFSEKIICNSDFTLSQFVMKNKVKKIYNPIPDYKIEEKLFNDNEFNIAIAGHLTSIKNIDIAIKAMVKLPDNFRLNIYGEEPYKTHTGYGEYLKKLVLMHELEKRVFFRGFVKNMAEVYSKNDLIISISSIESFGRVQFEALNSGKPVITTSTGFFHNKKTLKIPYVIDNRKIDEKTLADNIKNVFDNYEEYREKCKNFYMQIRDEFDSITINKKIAGVFNK